MVIVFDSKTCSELVTEDLLAERDLEDTYPEHEQPNKIFKGTSNGNRSSSWKDFVPLRKMGGASQ